MHFNLSEEQIMVRDAAREFAQTELLPGVIERDELQQFPDFQLLIHHYPLLLVLQYNYLFLYRCNDYFCIGAVQFIVMAMQLN